MCTVHTSLWPLEYIGSLSQRGFESLVRYFTLSSVKQAAVSSSLISSQGTSSGQRHVSPTSTRPAHIQWFIDTQTLKSLNANNNDMVARVWLDQGIHILHSPAITPRPNLSPDIRSSSVCWVVIPSLSVRMSLQSSSSQSF